MKPRVVITGLGVISSVGLGWAAFWNSVLAGRSGIKKIRYLDTSEFPTAYGGEVTEFEPLDFMDGRAAKRLGRGSQFAIAATRLALADAGLKTGVQHLRAGVCLGTTMADIQALESLDEAWLRDGDRGIKPALVTRYPSCMMSVMVASHFGIAGPVIMIPTACAAGNYAIGYGADLIRLGKVDVVIAGGVDPFSRIAFTGFSRIFALAPEKCQPFDKHRKGTLIGEGAGVMILERLETAQKRGARLYAEILGCGYSCDGHHMTIPDGRGIVRVMQNAMADAKVEPRQVDYISAHGTGTLANDRTEAAAIRTVFGEMTDQLPVSSVKSMIGHTMGAASALEAIVCALAVKYDRLPPTINHEADDPECPIDCVPNVARDHMTRIALNNSFAFGGNNACLVLGDVATSN